MGESFVSQITILSVVGPGRMEYRVGMRRVLIVDDCEDTRMMLGKLLGMSGHETIFAANGWEALLTLDNTHVDLVLLDLMMPGMDGSTFLRILRQSQRKQKLPVVIVTALNYGEAQSDLGLLGVDSYLMKNEDLFNKLLSVVDGALANLDGSASDAVSPQV
jgi:CheY-like chemotaxis protein